MLQAGPCSSTCHLQMCCRDVALSLWRIGEAPWKPSWSWNQPLEPCFCAVYETP